MLTQCVRPTHRPDHQGMETLQKPIRIGNRRHEARHTAPIIRGWKRFEKTHGSGGEPMEARHTAPIIRGWKLKARDEELVFVRRPDTPPRSSGDGNKSRTFRFANEVRRARHTAPIIRGWKLVGGRVLVPKSPLGPTHRPDHQGMETSIPLRGSWLLRVPDTPPRSSGDGNYQ